MMITKICTKCNLEKFINEFYSRKDSKDGYRTTCKTCDLKRVNEYIKNNKNKKIKYHSEYRKNNSQKLALKSKLYRNNNKDTINFYFKNRKITDTQFNLSSALRSIICNSFRRNGYVKNSKTHQIIGCSFEEFKQYLESKFEPWMNWSNRGKYNGELNHGWDIDHITPLSSVETEEDMIRLNHYTNLQPLCSYINRYIKKDNI